MADDALDSRENRHATARRRRSRLFAVLRGGAGRTGDFCGSLRMEEGCGLEAIEPERNINNPDQTQKVDKDKMTLVEVETCGEADKR